jgi:hypothetical protein
MAAGGVGYVIFNQVVLVLSDLPSYRENINKKIMTFRTPNKGALGRAAQSVKEIVQEKYGEAARREARTCRRGAERGRHRVLVASGSAALPQPTHCQSR